ncbi:aldose 1-epimerase [Hyunsoonleella pacifica]|uniref:Aldose 1-epimerase n=1 Tax=Hyunsoonleella pacifica TaxID=1080224 RepID=A0A4Q9FSC5_9FLAO|nr:aldose 1-epimerase [Hyunsoonleella pacifica]TBN19018.1 aldose 1-epimerase [Hyunsoonleella pacifica]GGD06669.1 aldose epimerase [Hyunsoonleella pacifica]
MYKINHNKKLNILEVSNSDTSVYGKIQLDQGASLQELILDSHKIIQDLNPLPYSNTYASSILFPFANRIKDGKYEFNGKTYQFKKNQAEEQNALHGLVFDKTFDVIHKETTKDKASVTLEYVEKNNSIGFPYTYTIRLEYVFKQTGVDVKVSIENTDTKVFPFTLGWHPYFTSANLFDSYMNFESSEKITLGPRNITTGTTLNKNNNPLQIKDSFFDDCWILNSDSMMFKTPKYNLKFNSTGGNNFLQLYTPPRKNTIAIEPTTGVSDSFNNKIGLETLQPNETYNITWSLKINNN